MKGAKKILMLGWEYPPKITGGLGVACQGIAEGLAKSGHQVHFLLPKKSPKQVSQQVKLLNAAAMKPDMPFWKKKSTLVETLRETEIGWKLLPYLPAEVFEIAREKEVVIEKLEETEESELLEKIKLTGNYEDALESQLLKYALLATQTARKIKPKIIHAHDWVTFQAGIMVKETLGLPLFVHVHSTEYDRNGGFAQSYIIEQEKKGFEQADHIFCVSEKLKASVVEKFEISADKISVVPNAVSIIPATEKPNRKPKTLAFIGRFTKQKSPTTFIDLARELTSKGHDFEYLMIGDGHLRPELEKFVNRSNFSDRFTFTGFMDRDKVLRKLADIDLLVVPSNSEPFGLVALEAVSKKVPVVAATGVGIAEFIPGIPQMDRWNQFGFIKLVELLMTDTKKRTEVTETCYRQASKLSWDKSTKIIEKAYQTHA